MALNLVCAVLDRGPADLAEMAVLLAIADSADKDTGEAWPSQATIAKRSRQTDRSVRNVLERLRAAGWLTWEARNRANGSRASNVYTVNLHKLGEGSERQAAATRNHVPGGSGTTFRGVAEPRSGHAPEPPSALEPSQKKEPYTRAASARSAGRSAASRGATTRPALALPRETGQEPAPVPLAQRAALAAAFGLPVRDPVTGEWRRQLQAAQGAEKGDA